MNNVQPVCYGIGQRVHHRPELRWSMSKGERRLLSWHAPVTAAAANDAWRVGRVSFIFQQDSAPAHRARDTVWLLELAMPAFNSPDLWPPNSPDLNPVDYKIWSVVQQRVYQSRMHNTDELKQRLVHVWLAMDQTIIDSAIYEWRGRLRACVRAKGGHCEQMLWHLLRRLLFSSVTINVLFVTLCPYHTIYRVHLCDFKEIWTLEFP